MLFRSSWTSEIFRFNQQRSIGSFAGVEPSPQGGVFLPGIDFGGGLWKPMKPGDKLIIYETGDNKSAVGNACVVAVKDPNPKNPQIEIGAGKPLAKPVALAEIKANKLFSTSPLVKMGRLSVVPLTAEQYKSLTGS